MSANLYFIFGNAKLLREIWGEFTNNDLFLLIIIHGTGDGIAWNGGRRGDGTEDKGEGGKKKGRKEKRKGRKKGGKKKGGKPHH